MYSSRKYKHPSSLPITTLIQVNLSSSTCKFHLFYLTLTQNLQQSRSRIRNISFFKWRMLPKLIIFNLLNYRSVCFSNKQIIHRKWKILVKVTSSESVFKVRQVKMNLIILKFLCIMYSTNYTLIMIWCGKLFIIIWWKLWKVSRFKL